MSELQINLNEATGIAKEFDEGSYDSLFDFFQSDAYSYPIRSFVRETISNALDAIIERDIAKEIIDGVPAEQYYRQEQDGALLKDSMFDDKYYSPKYLSDQKYVTVKYQLGEGRDSIAIKDLGIGLFGDRLKGYFKIG